MSTNTAGVAATVPHWVKLVRSGTVITAYASIDGATWMFVGSDRIPMVETVYVGLAVGSHTTGIPATAFFDRVSVTSGGS
jgi:hypothetical protein